MGIYGRHCNMRSYLRSSLLLVMYTRDEMAVQLGHNVKLALVVLPCDTGDKDHVTVHESVQTLQLVHVCCSAM
jgi:hypothetical protein